MTESTKNKNTEIIEVTTPEQLEALIKDDKEAVIKFYANWCGACNHLASYYQDVAREFNGSVSFYSIDVNNKDLMEKANALKIPKEQIMYLPTLVFLQPGKTHEQITGAPTKEALIDKVKSIFEN